MPGTFSQLYVQVVFAVGGRQNLIAKSWSQELYKYMSGIITAKNQKSIIVNGMPDHIHIFIGLRPSMAVSDLVRDVKNNSTNFINERHFVNRKFFLAGRIWSVFLFPFTGNGCLRLHIKSGRASCEEDIQRGIHRFAEKI